MAQDAEVIEKLDIADEQDKKAQEQVEAYMKPLREKSDFAKVMAYNHPKILIIPACLAVSACGFSQPLFGWIFSKIMQTMTLPVAYLKIIHGDGWKDHLKGEVTDLAMYTVYIAIAMFVGYMGKSYIFGYLGENVTMKVR